MANSFRSYTRTDVTTTADVYTAPASTEATVIGMTIANTTASNITCSVTLYDGGIDAHLVKDATILPGGALVPIGGDQKVVLTSGYKLRVTSSGTTDVIVSVLEVTV